MTRRQFYDWQTAGGGEIPATLTEIFSGAVTTTGDKPNRRRVVFCFCCWTCKRQSVF